MDRQTLTTKIIHYSQRPKTLSVKHIIRHEIHTPALIDMRQGRAMMSACCTDMPAGALPAQVKPFQAINPMCLPDFPPQLDMNTRATVSVSGFLLFPGYAGLLPDSHADSASGRPFCSASATRIPGGH